MPPTLSTVGMGIGGPGYMFPFYEGGPKGVLCVKYHIPQCVWKSLLQDAGEEDMTDSQILDSAASSGFRTHKFYHYNLGCLCPAVPLSGWV